MTGYIDRFNENKNKNATVMSFKANDKQRLKNCNKIWEKIERLMIIEFDSEPIYGDKYIKTKIKTYEDSRTTNFYNEKGSKKIPEEKIPCKCLSIIILDSIPYAYKKYHPKILLEECKYKQQQQQQQQKNYKDKELKSDSDNDE